MSVAWPVTVTVRSPFVFRGLRQTDAVVDAPAARDAAGRLLLPGTTLRGVLRDAVAALARRADGLVVDGHRVAAGSTEDALFGRPSGGEGAAADTPASWRVDNEPVYSDVEVGDLLADAPAGEGTRPDRGDGTWTRVALDRELGSVREGHLQVIELPAPMGADVSFRGEIRYHGAAVPAPAALRLLRLAAPLVRAMGGAKSAGFGEVVGLEIGDPTAEARPSAPAAALQPAPAIDLDLEIDRPFVVNADQPLPNLFRGAAVVPGGALKGAWALALRRDGAMDAQMSELLAAIRVEHAFPVLRDGRTARPERLPLSLVSTARGVRDVLLVDDVLPVAPGGAWEGPWVFQDDWKGGDGAARERVGLPFPDLARDVRTRTRVDRESGGAFYDSDAEAGALFTHSAVVPWGCGGRADPILWRTRLVLPDAALASPALPAALDRLARGLGRLGKTKARVTAWPAAAAYADTPDPSKASVAHGGGTAWCLGLVTDALLFTTEAMRRAGSDVEALYRTYLAGHGLTLVRFYAEQRLVGGYQALRYPQAAERYEPYVTTRAGSVFLVADAGDGRGADALARWLRDGMDLPQELAGASWRGCPFVPGNGYGAIGLNLVDHAALRADRS